MNELPECMYQKTMAVVPWSAEPYMPDDKMAERVVGLLRGLGVDASIGVDEIEPMVRGIGGISVSRHGKRTPAAKVLAEGVWGIGGSWRGEACRTLRGLTAGELFHAICDYLAALSIGGER